MKTQTNLAKLVRRLSVQPNAGAGDRAMRPAALQPQEPSSLPKQNSNAKNSPQLHTKQN